LQRWGQLKKDIKAAQAANVRTIVAVSATRDALPCGADIATKPRQTHVTSPQHEATAVDALLRIRHALSLARGLWITPGDNARFFLYFHPALATICDIVKLISLRYFNEVAALGSIRRAAEQLHVAPSAVSRQIAQLERDLDMTLFFRSKAGVQLTNAGEVYWRQTRRVLLDLTHARQSLDDMRGLRRGEVRLYVIEGILFDFVPRIISAFHARYPGIQFTVHTASTDQIVAALMEREADIGLTFNAAPRAEIQVIEEFIEPVSCLVAPTHRFADASLLKMSSLVDEPMALAESSFGLRQIVEKALRRYRNSFAPVITTNSLELTKAMAMTGTMIAFLPMLNVQRELAEGSLRAIPIDSKELSESRTSVCIHRDRPLSFAGREFLKALREAFQALNAPTAAAAHKRARKRVSATT